MCWTTCKIAQSPRADPYRVPVAGSRYSEALKETKDKALKGRLLANRCLALCKGGRVNEGLADANQLICERPGWDKAWFRRGTAQIGLQQPVAALDSFRRSFYLSRGKQDATAANKRSKDLLLTARLVDEQTLWPSTKRLYNKKLSCISAVSL